MQISLIICFHLHMTPYRKCSWTFEDRLHGWKVSKIVTTSQPTITLRILPAFIVITVLSHFLLLFPSHIPLFLKFFLLSSQLPFRPDFLSPYLCHHPVRWRCVSSQSSGSRWQHHSCFPHPRSMRKEKPESWHLYLCCVWYNGACKYSLFLSVNCGEISRKAPST